MTTSALYLSLKINILAGFLGRIPARFIVSKRAVLCLFALGLYTAGAQAELVGKVVSVSDGDTVTVLDVDNVQHKIRLAGIDAPEKRQAFGARARQNLADVVFGKTVDVRTSKKDKYGRTVGLLVLNGNDINLLQVQSGYAWHYRQYAAEQSPVDRQRYSEAELDARQQGRGLWSEVAPIPPWEFRKQRAAKP